MPEYVYNFETRKVEPKPQGWPRLYPGMRTDDSDYPRPNDLLSTDSLGSVRTRDGLVEAVCWTHRGSGWDVIGPDGTGAAVRTKREAYALARKLHREATASGSDH